MAAASTLAFQSIGNLSFGEDGYVEISIVDAQIPLTGANSTIGRAVVDLDDLGKGGHELSKTTGNQERD
ncbi:hypothetical protein L7F22_050358 [Adiantum nelumboides]|nr:hypothetical protein [Adiantum nelumboides]